MSAVIAQQVVALADTFISQQRYGDALLLLESVISSDSACAQEAGSALRDLQLRYARCLFSLNRYEAALFVIELCGSTAAMAEDNILASLDPNSTASAAAAAAAGSGARKRDGAGASFMPSLAAATTTIAGAVEAAPPRCFVEGGRDALVHRLPALAIKTAMECALALQDWPRTKLYANALLIVPEPPLGDVAAGSGGSYCTTALCALGRLACASSAPLDAAEYLCRALRMDPFCSSALDMLVDHWLLPTAEVEQLVLNLDFSSSPLSPSHPSTAGGGDASLPAGASNVRVVGELVRNMYLARIPDAAVQLVDPMLSSSAFSSSKPSQGVNDDDDDLDVRACDSIHNQNMMAQPSSQGSGNNSSSTSQTALMLLPTWLRNFREAIVLLEANDLEGALRCSSAALAATPLRQHVACLHLSILTQMHETAGLFRFAHSVSESFPSSAVSFYAAGCYYYSIGNFERAGRLFSRATDLDSLFAEAWVAYGHCYARLEEGEQALAAYRRAQNLFPGLRHCELFLGIQYARQHSAQLAMACLENAQRSSSIASSIRSSNDGRGGRSQIPRALPASSFDALLLNETAVLHFRSMNYTTALQLLLRARDALPNKERPADHEMCVIFNLASVLRKVHKYDLAAQTYQAFIRLRPQASVGHCAYGFTLHIQGDLDAAIAAYRTSLSLRRDAFCRDLLERALDERHGVGYLAGASGSVDNWLKSTSSSASSAAASASTYRQQQQQQQQGVDQPPLPFDVSLGGMSSVTSGGNNSSNSHHQQHQQHQPSPIPAGLQQQMDSLRGPSRGSTATGTAHSNSNLLDTAALLLPPVVHRRADGTTTSSTAWSSAVGNASTSTVAGVANNNNTASPQNRPTISRALSFGHAEH